MSTAANGRAATSSVSLELAKGKQKAPSAQVRDNTTGTEATRSLPRGERVDGVHERAARKGRECRPEIWRLFVPLFSSFISAVCTSCSPRFVFVVILDDRKEEHVGACVRGVRGSW